VLTGQNVGAGMVASPKAAGKAGKSPWAELCSGTSSKQSPSPSRRHPALSPPPRPAGEHMLGSAVVECRGRAQWCNIHPPQKNAHTDVDHK